MTQLRVGEAVIDLLVRHYGLDTVFGIPGVHNIELFRGLHRFGVRLVSPRHEQGAGFMADGWSVVTGRPGVCCVISGPGLTNTLTPMAQAFHDSRPMLVLASTTPTAALGQRVGPLHDLDDQALLARSVCAISETVTDAAAIPSLLEAAWDVFESRRPRPVHLAFPTDVLSALIEPFERAASRARATTEGTAAASASLSGLWPPADGGPIPSSDCPSRPRADPALIVQAARLLSSARTPMIVAGGGAIDAGEELRELAERLDAPVVLTNNAKGLLASDHPLCGDSSLWFASTQRAIEAADVVLVVGSELGDADLDSGGEPLRFAGSVVRIDIDPDQLARRVSPEIAIWSDAASALAELSASVPAATDARNGAQRAADVRQQWRSGTRSNLVPWLEALERSIPTDAIVAVDSTQLGYAAQTWLPARHTRSWLAPFGYGTLGCAVPMAIGAAVAAPQRPVIALVGDGGWLFTVAEMATAADLALNTVVVLWDNRGYAQIHQSFLDTGAEPMGVDVSSFDPAMIARGFGWTAQEVTEPTALSTAVTAAVRAGGPQFIRVIAG